MNKFPFSKVAGIFYFPLPPADVLWFPHSPTHYVPESVSFGLEASGI